MSSASQIDLETIPEDQLAETLSKVKSLRETEELRARLPAQLAPFASNISITEPIQSIRAYPPDGIHDCSCKVKERRIRMSVTVVPSSESQEPEEPHAYAYAHTKPLELVWRDWETSSRYYTGGAGSHTLSISLKYGRRGMRSKATTVTAEYGDPGICESESSHGGIKSVVEEVVRDMGLRECELDNQLEVIEALLGDDGRRILEGRTQDGPTLRKVIENELEEVYQGH